jgi:UDP-N-acetylmuramoyl-tripeptide--D-alanyl-D-alanine ligase
MGASKNGDIQELTNIVKPKIVALLNVSPAHLDSFKTLENIIITKEEILDNQGYKKIVILNIDDPNYQRWEAKSKNNIVKTISQNQHADYYLQSNTSSNLLIKTYKGDELNIDNNKLEKHEIYNILFSIACSMEAGATSNNVIQGLKNARDIRGRFFKINGYNKSNIIDSTYNANPESFKAAICSLSKINGKKWLIMGDMGELGKDARKYHIEIGDFAKKNKVEKIFLISKYSKEIKKNFGDGSYSFLTTSELIEFIKPMITEDVNILIKASRFMKFEVIVDALSIGKY